MNPKPKPKVLIVDDEEEIACMIASFLKEEGYETLTAFDGETAFQLIETSKPDVILLDLNIPKLSGLEILERISAKNLGARLPAVGQGSARPCGGKPKETGVKVLIFSGLATKEDKERAFALGASGYLNKPIQIDTLLRILEEL